MKITICGSIKFANKLVEIYHKLEKLGHQPMMHEEMFNIADGSAKKLIQEAKENHGATKRKYNFIKIWHEIIVSGNAILVCNFTKNNIENYIGGNTLMEIGFAHVHDKKVFLLNSVPEKVNYTDEINVMVDKVIDGDLTKIF